MENGAARFDSFLWQVSLRFFFPTHHKNVNIWYLHRNVQIQDEVVHEGARYKQFVSTFEVKSGGCHIIISQSVKEETARGLDIQFTEDHLQAKSFA